MKVLDIADVVKIPRPMGSPRSTLFDVRNTLNITHDVLRVSHTVTVSTRTTRNMARLQDRLRYKVHVNQRCACIRANKCHARRLSRYR